MTDHATPLSARTDAILRRLVRRESDASLRRVLGRTRIEDIAAAMELLTWGEQRRLYDAVEDLDKRAELLSLLPDDTVQQITREMTEEAVADLVERMEPDDATDLVSSLPNDMRERVLEELDEGEAGPIETLLEWPADTAGGIMSTDFFAVPETSTCGAAVRLLQQSSDERENVHYVYVTDREQRLVGVVSLRMLVVRTPATPLASIMSREPITIGPLTDQEEVARFVARYDLLALPVVDEDRRLLGIVTVDDVVDVIREEAAEDMRKMAGVSEPDDAAPRSLLRNARTRAGWLAATLVGGLVNAEIIGTFSDSLTRVAVLAGFLPVVMGMGGNVGVQSATLAVQGLATGAVQRGGAPGFVWREVRVGLLLAVAFAAALATYGYLRFPERPMIGATVGAAVVASITAASLVGAGIPMLLARLRIDPAIATGPLVTSCMDLVGILVYFNTARLLLGI